VLDGDLVAEEPCRVRAGVGDQRLALGQLQLEVIAQELGEMTLDLLGFGLRSGEPEQDVVGVADVTQSPVPGILRISGRESALLLAQRPRRGFVAPFAGLVVRRAYPAGRRVTSPADTAGVPRYQNCLDKRVQPMQVDVGQDRGENPAV